MAHQRKIAIAFGMDKVDHLSLSSLTKEQSKDQQQKWIGCTPSCSGICQIYSPKKSVKKMYQRFYEYYKRGEFVDVVLRTEEGGSYPVHRIVLCGESEFFRALFTSGVNSTNQTEIQLHQVSNEFLEIAIHFMYKFEACLNYENVVDVLMFADYLGIMGLKNLCCDFIAMHIDSKNVIGIYEFAKEQFCKELEEKAYKFIMKNFTQVSQHSKEFLELSLDHIGTIFGSDELNVKSEETVWIAVLRWINHNPAERKKYILELLKQIRTGLMDANFFVENVKDHPLVVGNASVKPLIIQTIRFFYDLEIKDKIPNLTLKPHPRLAVPRLPSKIIFAVGGWFGGTPSNCIEAYDIRADRWKSLHHEILDSVSRAYHGSSTILNEIILIGGFDGARYFNTVRGFNVITQKWRYLAPMAEKRCYVAVAKLHNHVYVFGGYNGHHRLNTCERYDPERNQWSQIASMNSQRSDASATAYNEKIYVCGGFNGVECLSCAEVYDPKTNQWTYISSMRQRRSGVGCMAYHGSIYALGGFSGINRLGSCEKYNPTTGTWCPVADMYHKRSNFGCAIVDDMLFAIGGFDGASTIPHVECYDGKNREWYEAAELSHCRSALTCSVLKDLPNIQEYLHEKREFSMEERRHRYLTMGQAPAPVQPAEVPMPVPVVVLHQPGM